MRRVIPLLGLAILPSLSACAGGSDAAGGEASTEVAAGGDPSTDVGSGASVGADPPDSSAGGSGSGSTGAAGSTDGGSGSPFGTEHASGDRVQFVTTSSTTTTSTTTLPPTTTSTSTTTTLPPTTTSTTTSTTTTSTSTSTTTSTTVPPATTMRCSFAADALFEPGRAVLNDQAVAELGDAVAGVTEIRAVRVVGHTDHRGTEQENLALSQARADAAAAALVEAGIDAALINAVGLGEAEAHQGDPSDAEMAGDRRVDVEIDAEVPITRTC